MSEKKKTWIGAGLLVCGLVLILIGVKSDEVATVLQKSVNICLECIGIG